MASEAFFSTPDNPIFHGAYSLIPEHMQAAITRYIVHGIRPGDFLIGVITNDLKRAVNYADDENIKLLKLYVQWFYNEAPGHCWGSREAIDAWMRDRQEKILSTALVQET